VTTKIELEERATQMFYDIGLRGDDLIYMLELVEFESNWDTAADLVTESDDAVAEGFKTLQENSRGLVQINLDLKDKDLNARSDYRALNFTDDFGGLGYKSLQEAIQALDVENPDEKFWDATQKALSLVLSDQLYTHGPDLIFDPWRYSSRKLDKQRGSSDRTNETIRYENIADSVLPEDWYESDPNFDILRYNNFSNPANLGIRRSKVAAFQKYIVDNKDSNFVIDARTGPSTDAAVEEFQKENGLEDDGIIGDEVLETIANIEVDQQINEEVMADGIPPERTSYFSKTNVDGRPIAVSSENTNNNVVYNEQLDRYEPVSFSEDGLMPNTDLADSFEDQLREDNREQRRSFDPGPYPDQLDQSVEAVRRSEVIDSASDVAFADDYLYDWMSRRPDASIDGVNIVDIIKANTLGLKEGTEDFDRWVDSLLRQTDYFKNYGQNHSDNSTLWYEEGFNETWSVRRRDLVSVYQQSIERNLARLNINLSEDRILELAKFAWLSNLSDQEVNDYIADENIIDFTGGAIAGGSVSDNRSSIKNLYRKFLLAPNEMLLTEASEQLFRGDTTIDLIEDELRNESADIYPTFADRILAGRTPLQILSGYDQIYTSVMGANPQWDGQQKDVGIKIMSGDANVDDEKLTASNFATWLRTDPLVNYDAMPKAINNAYSLVKGLGQTFGAVA
tara:strand:+ start:13616 stop:15655 length:2040 start_codon:yes stop_codon:yes gene_type:complete